MNKTLFLSLSTVALLGGAYLAHADVSELGACLETYCPNGGCYFDKEKKEAHCCNATASKCESDSVCPDDKYCEPNAQYCVSCPEYRGMGGLCTDHCACASGQGLICNSSHRCACPTGATYNGTKCVCSGSKDLCGGVCCTDTQECKSGVCETKSCSFNGSTYASGAKVADCGICSSGTVVQNTGITTPVCKVCSTTNWTFTNATDGTNCGTNMECKSGACVSSCQTVYKTFSFPSRVTSEGSVTKVGILGPFDCNYSVKVISGSADDAFCLEGTTQACWESSGSTKAHGLSYLKGTEIYVLPAGKSLDVYVRNNYDNGGKPDTSLNLSLQLDSTTNTTEVCKLSTQRKCDSYLNLRAMWGF